MKVYRIKESKLEDFKKDPEKFGFHYLESMKVYEHKDDYKNGKLWVYSNGNLSPTFYSDTIKSNDKVIKHLMSQGYVEVHYE